MRRPFFLGPVTCRLRVVGREAVGPYGPALIVLRQKPEFFWDVWAEDIIDVQTHDVLARCPRTGVEVKVAQGIRRKDDYGTAYVSTAINIPVVFYDRTPGEVVCRIGTRPPPPVGK